MCFNLGKFDFLVNPTAIVRKAAAEALGVDETAATVLSGDFFSHKNAVKKEEEERAKKTRANNEAWQRYYASREEAAKMRSPLTAIKN